MKAIDWSGAISPKSDAVHEFHFGITSHPDAFYKSNIKITSSHWNLTCPQWLLPAFGRCVCVCANVMDCDVDHDFKEWRHTMIKTLYFLFVADNEMKYCISTIRSNGLAANMQPVYCKIIVTMGYIYKHTTECTQETFTNPTSSFTAHIISQCLRRTVGIQCFCKTFCTLTCWVVMLEQWLR